jgi:tRNA pseudouridine38-40 synthase
MIHRNIKLAITYDGYGYHGWQVQPGKPTIQGTIEEALKKLTNQDISIVGASRTDAGVSAIGQVANFKIDSPIPTDKFAIALNSLLPDEIAVTKSEEADEKFNARFNAKSKQYQYKIFAGSVRPVLNIHHCWFYPYGLDFGAMQQAAGFLVGTHDFKSFASSGDDRVSTVRTVFRCDVQKIDEWITITIEGDGFLYNMVRNIVGTLAEIKHRQWKPEYIKDILQAKDRAKAGILSPADGLCLMWIKYD